MGAAVGSSHNVSAAPSSSLGGLLTLFSCSSVGSLPRETVLHEFLQHESFLWAAVLHKLLQHGSPMGSRVLPANLLRHGLLSPQVLPGGCSSAGFPRGHSLLRTAPLLWGPPQDAGGDLLPSP